MKSKNTAILAFTLLLLSACGSNGPEAIKLNKDNCDYCKMTIANGQFASELKTAKGRFYKFDDISCMVAYKKENPNTSFSAYYVNDFLGKNELIDAEKAFYIQSEEIGSPMGGNIAAFKNKEVAKPMMEKYKATETSWVVINR